MAMKFESISGSGSEAGEDAQPGTWDEISDAASESTEDGEAARLKGYENTLSLMRPLSKEAAKNFEITTESRNFRLGGLARQLFSANQAEKIDDFLTVRLDDIRGMFTENNKRGFRLFFQDRYSQNVQRLSEFIDEDAANTLVGAYSDMMNDFPELRNVRIDATYLNDGNNARAFYGKDVSGKILPTVQLESSIIYDATNISTRIPEDEYYRRRELYNQSGFVRDEIQHVAVPKRVANMVTTINSVAEKLEIEPAKLAQDRKLLGTIMLAHELGHHLDFRRNYFGAAMDEGGDKKEFGEILQAAFVMKMRDDAADPGTIQFRTMMGVARRTQEQTATYKSDGEIMQQMQTSQNYYREQKAERIADTFAADFVRKYAKKYGFDEAINQAEAA